jgi:hypothetical protein
VLRVVNQPKCRGECMLCMSICSAINRKHPDMLTSLSYCTTMSTFQDTLHFMHWKMMNCSSCSSDMSPCDYYVFDPLGINWLVHLPLYPMGLFSMAAVSFSIKIPNEFHFNKTQRLCSKWLRSPNSLLTIFISTEYQGCEADHWPPSNAKVKNGIVLN